MATQLAVQRNFVRITSTNQIASNVQSAQSAMTTSADEDLVTITTAGTQTTQPDSNGVQIISAHTQVISISTNYPHFLYLPKRNLLRFSQKKYILQTGTTSEGVSIIDVVPIDQSDSADEAPITVSAILPANSTASSPNSSNSQQITAQVAFVQAPEIDEDTKPQFITVNGKCSRCQTSFPWDPYQSST